MVQQKKVEGETFKLYLNDFIQSAYLRLFFLPPNDICIKFVGVVCFLGRAQTNLAKLLLAKALLLKHARTCFLLLKI